MTCDAAIDITLYADEHVGEDARHFVIFPGRFVGDIEWIAFENDRFAVVLKREGVPADVAPRASLSNRMTPRPDTRTLAELLIDCEEDRTLRAVHVGILREADR